ncbi:predicted protein [Histoplasma capsulatum G186AR]|uniref:Uncharacterized protein n=1 Tax=Ajellomyces capsulatus (strain G186AR / H82 / ATCC MYA-2454 / RMSCC 2432) TaxID=447093 RepID=C0NQZ7_AJECG|nr:uncharacterized protein HCBG_05427 [Histoplasma capsulatum G186AR]EEH06111.1 predicted protein [Histoplasma capsulatum G186AR]
MRSRPPLELAEVGRARIYLLCRPGQTSRGASHVAWRIVKPHRQALASVDLETTRLSRYFNQPRLGCEPPVSSGGRMIQTECNPRSRKRVEIWMGMQWQGKDAEGEDREQLT